MTRAVIVSTARTPLTKSWKGSFNMTHGATLGGHAVQHAVARAGIEAAEVEEVDQCRLARAVVPDQPHALAARQLQVDAAQRLHGPERARRAADLDQPLARVILRRDGHRFTWFWR